MDYCSPLFCFWWGSIVQESEDPGVMGVPESQRLCTHPVLPNRQQLQDQTTEKQNTNTQQKQPARQGQESKQQANKNSTGDTHWHVRRTLVERSFMGRVVTHCVLPRMWIFAPTCQTCKFCQAAYYVKSCRNNPCLRIMQHALKICPLRSLLSCPRIVTGIAWPLQQDGHA